MCVGESRCDALAAASLTALAAALDALPGADSADAAGGEVEGREGKEGPKRKRVEDSLSSALCIAAKMEDLHAQQRALQGWTKHYESVGDAQQASAFGDLFQEFAGKHGRTLKKARRSALPGLIELAQQI